MPLIDLFLSHFGHKTLTQSLNLWQKNFHFVIAVMIVIAIATCHQSLNI